MVDEDGHAAGGDVLSRVRKMLEAGGYPLEMRVARTLNDAGLTVRQAMHYQATGRVGEGVAREIDVLAWRSTGTSSPLLIVECKSKPDPWVLFVGEPAIEDVPQPLAERIFSYMLGEPLAAEWLHNETPLLELQPIWGHSLTAMKTGQGKDSAYDAVRQVLSGADGALAAMRDRGEAVAFPLIVTTGPLVSARLDPAGAIQLANINRAQLRQFDPAVSDRPVLIDIITEDALPQYATDAYATFEALDLGD